MYFALFEIYIYITQKTYINTLVFSYSPRLFIASGLHGDVIVILGHINFVKSKNENTACHEHLSSGICKFFN